MKHKPREFTTLTNPTKTDETHGYNSNLEVSTQRMETITKSGSDSFLEWSQKSPFLDLLVL